MTRPAILLFIPLLVLGACTRTVPSATVELIDTSLSITPQAEKAALKAAQSQISHMGRGDILVLIPITGNAENDAGGRILRLQAPTRREPYDSDLRRFRDAAQKQFSAWATALGSTEPCRTDILGSLDAAVQALAAMPKGSKQRLIIASDFIEDDDRYRFGSDPRLADVGSAHQLAAQLRSQHSFNDLNVATCLGRLESAQFEGLSPARRQAIREFWTTYTARQGQIPDIQLDGIGMLTGSENTCPSPRVGSDSDARR